MNNYIGVAVVDKLSSCQRYLYQAPAWKNIKKGDEVICETENGKRSGIVIDFITLEKNADYLNFLLNAMSTTSPLPKILSIVRYDDVNYESKDN